MSQLLDVLLLTALPASGKSEVRKYLASLTADECRDGFHLGPTVQLDDYPYVHLMRSVSQALLSRGEDGVFFDSDERPMKEPLDWGALVHLINEDFDDLVLHRRPEPASAANWMLERFDRARIRVGAPPAFRQMAGELRAFVAESIRKEAEELLAGKNAGAPASLEGKTVVIEFARGGKQGSTMPLAPPYGYRYAFSQLSEALLSRSSVLYVWVTPEESRRKNVERADPGKAEASNKHLSLHHGVPEAVMLGEYGCDDLAWLVETSDRPDTVRIEAHGKTFHVPVARFDNRVDKTTFARGDPATWRPEAVQLLHDGLAEAFAKLAAARG